jgi:N-acetylmuramoyl-L-alanine amidase
MPRAIAICVLLALLTAGGLTAQGASPPTIVQRPVLLSEHRLALMREYSRLHYGREMVRITPRAVVVHWTVLPTAEETYARFYPEETQDSEMRAAGRLNVAAHFLVDRDGTVYQLTPETYLNRHAIGLNWCAIGIENVGGASGTDDLTEAQLAANGALIRQLYRKYPTITHVLGHYQQDQARQASLWREDVDGYYAEKIDPGPRFMAGLARLLGDLPLRTLPL